MIGIGKTIANINHSNGMNYAIFNDSHPLLGDTVFYNENGKEKYSLQALAGNGDRCGVFTCSANQITAIKRPVLYLPDKDTYNTAYPIYEMISPSVTFRGASGIVLSWWSNIADYAMFYQQCRVYDQANASEYYIYSPSHIRRFTAEELETGEVETGGDETRVLCHGDLQFEWLLQSGADLKPILYPVIYKIYIASVFVGQGYYVDFACGDGSGRARMHNHTSNEECGFAAAVYMPSAFIRPFNWK